MNSIEAKWPARPPTSAATSSNETRVDQRLVFFGSRGTGGCPTSKELDDMGSRSVSGATSEVSGTGGSGTASPRGIDAAPSTSDSGTGADSFTSSFVLSLTPTCYADENKVRLNAADFYG